MQSASETIVSSETRLSQIGFVNQLDAVAMSVRNLARGCSWQLWAASEGDAAQVQGRAIKTLQ
jgi:hypothetical protein